MMNETGFFGKLNKYSFFLCYSILVFLLIAGAIYCWFLGDKFFYWDEELYYKLAMNLHTGSYTIDGTSPTAFNPPGYPFTLFIFSFFNSSVSFLRFCNYLFFALTLFMAYWLLKKEVSRLAGLLAVCIGAIYPLFFYTAGTLYPQIEASFFLLFAVFFAFLGGTTGAIISGISLACAILAMPMLVMYIPFFAFYPLFFKQPKKLQIAMIFMISCFLVLGGWTLRNYVALDRFVFISTNGGANFLIGNSAKTTATSGTNVDLSAQEMVAKNMHFIDRDNYYRDEAFKWIWENPQAAVKLYFLKALNYYNYSNQLAERSQQSYTRDFIAFFSYYPLLFLFLLRILFVWKFPLSRLEGFLLFLCLISPFLQAVFFTRVRFRIPFDFLMIMLSASFLAHYLEKDALYDSPEKNSQKNN